MATTKEPIMAETLPREYQMTESQLETLKNAGRPTTAIFLSGGQPAFGSPQENANIAWRNLAAELGFQWDTVRPSGGDERKFYAIPIKAAGK